MRGNKELETLNIIARVGMATVYHFQPWTVTNAGDLNKSLQWPTRIFNRLVKAELITPLQIYPTIGRQYRYNTFFVPTAKGYKVANIKYKYKDGIALTNLHHQFGLIDICISLIKCFPDYSVTFEYDRVLKFPGYNYKPDAIAHLKDSKGKVYNYIIEFERSRSPKSIYLDKLAKNHKMTDFDDFDLSKYTKFLYVFTNEWYRVFNRPIEYEDHKINNEIQSVENDFFLLTAFGQYIEDYKFRFLPYHQFTRLAEPIWVTPKGNKVSLI